MVDVMINVFFVTLALLCGNSVCTWSHNNFGRHNRHHHHDYPQNGFNSQPHFGLPQGRPNFGPPGQLDPFDNSPNFVSPEDLPGFGRPGFHHAADDFDPIEPWGKPDLGGPFEGMLHDCDDEYDDNSSESEEYFPHGKSHTTARTIQKPTSRSEITNWPYPTNPTIPSPTWTAIRPTQATLKPVNSGPIWTLPTTPLPAPSTNRVNQDPSLSVKQPSPKLGPTSTTTLKPPSMPSELMAACLRSCPVTSEYNPFCGTDNKTYENTGRLLCAQQCGVDVQVKSLNRCSSSDLAVGASLTPTTTPSSRNRQTPDAIRSCMGMCKNHPDIRPVCGTNNQTYYNIERLQCAQKCGEVVDLLCPSACGTNTCNAKNLTTPTLPRVTLDDLPASNQCVRMCPLTTEYNPVCGTNNITYDNPGKLLCAQFCGIDVKVQRFSTCLHSKPSKDVPGGRNDLTESDAAVETTVTFPPANVDSSTTEANQSQASSTKFYIDPDVLEQIFGTSTSQPEPTTESDEIYAIDIRQSFDDSTEAKNKSENVEGRIVFRD